MGDSSNAHSALLDLPTEIRCHIYDYLLSDRQAITISAGYVTVLGHRIEDRARKLDIPGLPLDLAPLVRCHHDTSVLSVANPPTVSIEEGGLDDSETRKPYPAPLALLQTCRVINDELTDYTRGKRRIAQARSSGECDKTQDSESDKEGLSIYVTYPYGVLVLKHQYPYLLKQARRVFISGYFTSPTDAEPGSPASTASAESNEGERLTPANSFTGSNGSTTPVVRSFVRGNSARNLRTSTANSSATATTQSTRPRLRLDPPLPHQRLHTSETWTAFPLFSPSTAKLAPLALAHLVRTILPAEPTHLIKLSARIVYTGENSYSSVWSDENSPVTHTLRSITGGMIALSVKRGGLGTGLCLTARPQPNSRIVSTTWENWRVTQHNTNSRSRRTARMGLKELDAFLMDEE
ncbi:hypothetical protein IQ07DRAFT_582916 [Pyrenochaeta sp. DS3sAY3a]|nr:hypothetical protein IQ07DRAFT_582916 [Pyrenochaeta sp. DS3sAY3a]